MEFSKSEKPKKTTTLFITDTIFSAPRFELWTADVESDAELSEPHYNLFYFKIRMLREFEKRN